MSFMINKYKASMFESKITVFLFLISSGTVFFFHNHALPCCLSIFLWGIFLSVRRSNFHYIFHHDNMLFMSIYVLWIWFNFLFINTNHTENVTLPFQYTFITVGTGLSCMVLKYDIYKKYYLNILAFICSISIIVFLLYSIGLFSPVIVSGPHGKNPMILFDVIRGQRMSSIYWEPSAFQVVLCLCLLLHIPELSKMKSLKKYKIQFIIIIISLLLSRSTSGYFGLIFIILVIILNLKIKRYAKLMLLPVLLISFVFISLLYNSSVVQNKLNEDYGGNSSTGSLNMRYYDNLALLRMISERPLVGYGLDSRDYISKSYHLNNYTASNGVLEMCAYLGIPIVLVYCVFLYRSLKKKGIGKYNILIFLPFIWVNCFNGMIVHAIVWSVFFSFREIPKMKRVKYIIVKE